MSYMLASEPQSIGSVLDLGIKLFRGGFRAVLALAVLSAVVAVAGEGVDLVLGEPGAGVLPQWAVALLSFGSAIVNLVIGNAITLRYWQMASGEGESDGAMELALRRSPRAIGAALLALLAMAGALVPAGIAVALLWGTRPIAAVVAAVLLGSVALYVAGRLMFAVVEVVVRASGAREALRRSWALTAGKFWRASLVALVIGIICGVFYFLLGVIVGLVAAVVSTSPLVIGLVTLVVVALVVVVVTPYFSAAWLVLWHDLRLRTEGTDLAARIDALAPG